MKNKFYLLAFFLLPFAVFAQESKPKQEISFLRNQFNVNLALHYFDKTHKCISLGADYGFNDFIEGGAYVGYWSLALGNSQNPNMWFYGIDAKAHIVQIFKPSFYYVDPYIAARIGGRTAQNMMVVDKRTMFEYGVFGGLGLNFTRHFGLFYELGYTNFKAVNHRFGLNVRFGGPKKWQKQ